MSLKRAIGNAILRQLAPRGLPIESMIRIARAGGGGYRYQDMRDDARKFTGRVKYQVSIERLPYNAVVPRAWTIETELAQPTKYRVFGKVTFYDEQAERYMTKNASFYTDDLAKTGDYGQMFFDHFQGLYSEEDLEITEFKQTGLEHNLGYAY